MEKKEIFLASDETLDSEVKADYSTPEISTSSETCGSCLNNDIEGNSTIQLEEHNTPLLPKVQGILCHDHSAFLCSLFNKIDLDKEKESCSGPFSTVVDGTESIIADAVKLHRPTGCEELPNYSDTISSMIINANKKVFKDGREVDQAGVIEPSGLSAQNLNALLDVNKIRQAVYGKYTSKPSLLMARSFSAPYPTQQLSRRLSLSELKQISDSFNHPVSSRSSYPEIESIDIGPMRTRKRMSSLFIDEDDGLTKNEQRLFEAVSTNNVGRIEFLLTTKSCDANIADGRGRSPLHIAAAHGFTHAARLLLEHGADPNRIDSIGNRPLDLALSGRQTHVAAELILAGTDATAEKDAAVAALCKLTRQILLELKSMENTANINSSKLYQTIAVLRHAMKSYQFNCPEVEEILEELKCRGLSDPTPQRSAVEELSLGLNKHLYFSSS